MKKVKISNLEIGNGTPKIMGILNVSPESFYKESISTGKKIISERASQMEKEGADIIDIGGMSTAPYLDTVISVEKEVERIRNSVKAVKEVCRIPVSVDTPRADVAKVSAELGVDLINDVTGLKYDERMKEIVFSTGLPVIIGAYGRKSITYRSGDIFETIEILQESLNLAHKKGISDNKIIIDPLIGFFRSTGNNPFFTKIAHDSWYERDLEIISGLKTLSKISMPICISVSRKSFIGKLFNLTESERLIPSIITQIICALNGASIIRTHDVKETKIGLELLQKITKDRGQNLARPN
ncbi:MAG: dihydropteroate synthase [Nitrososphaeraceae archaeon]|nr:dihydropteroate synthase [Nitrososphaeraceae archaeon]